MKWALLNKRSKKNAGTTTQTAGPGFLAQRSERRARGHSLSLSLGPGLRKKGEGERREP
jgi:hypothetical protein